MYSTKDSSKTITRYFHDSDYKYLNDKEIKFYTRLFHVEKAFLYVVLNR